MATPSVPQQERPVLIFPHLPKTGGTTLWIFLEFIYGEKNCYSMRRYKINDSPLVYSSDGWDRFLAMSQRKRDTLDCIHGHFSYGLHRLLSRPCLYITLMREPLERFCSNYHQFRREHHRYLELSKGKEYTLEDYIRDWDGADIESRAELYYSDMAFFDETVPEASADPAEWLKRKIAQTCADTEDLKQRLRDQYMLVGLTERFDDFLFLLCRIMGWKVPHDLKHHNVSHRKPASKELSPALQHQVREMMNAEYALYEYASTLFEEKWRTLGWTGRQYARLCRYRRHLYRNYDILRGVAGNIRLSLRGSR